MRVAIRVDAGALIGGGHAMRCLTLADALAARGADVSFVTAAMPEWLYDRIESCGHKVVRIAPLPSLRREGGDWHEPPLVQEDQAADAAASGAACGNVDWLIVDHYLLDARWHSAARSFARNVLVIDDLANRQYDCDLLLDQTFGRNAADYAELVPATARVLAGSNHALLRPEFEQERRAALDRRKAEPDIERVLVSIGTADLGGSTLKIIDQLLAVAPQCEIGVVLGPDASSLQHVRQLTERNGKLRLHVDTGEMARLMRDADLAIGAAGTTSWERCCLGLPTIALVLAENQRASATALAAAGAVIALERMEDVGPAIRQLLDHSECLPQMSAAAFPIVDGQGAERVASTIFGDEARQSKIVELRSATEADMELLWLWRNDPVTRAQSRNTDPISWKSHVCWVTGALADPSRKILIGERGGIPLGNVGLHQVNGETEVSIVVTPNERGTGVGAAMLRAACAANSAQDVFAAVRAGNEASRRLFESCGFTPVESSEPGFMRYVRRGEHRHRKQA
ncbi:MAG: UDP-2,4-diacetamido-2,4,6-trideoxy-beta-L-altropyranose hydrolase [Sphingomicrobium sp.]